MYYGGASYRCNGRRLRMRSKHVNRSQKENEDTNRDDDNSKKLGPSRLKKIQRSNWAKNLSSLLLDNVKTIIKTKRKKDKNAQNRYRRCSCTTVKDKNAKDQNKRCTASTACIYDDALDAKIFDENDGINDVLDVKEEVPGYILTEEKEIIPDPVAPIDHHEDIWTTSPFLNPKDINNFGYCTKKAKSISEKENSWKTLFHSHFLLSHLRSPPLEWKSICKSSRCIHTKNLPLENEPEGGVMWEYKNNENWKETICHSILFPESVSLDLMKRITTTVRSEVKKTEDPDYFIVKQIISWQKTLILSTILKVAGTIHNMEILVHLAEKGDKLCVASESMSVGMRRLVICAKGLGSHIWEGGYDIVRRAVDRVLLDGYRYLDYEEQEICPHCLQKIPIKQACVWNWNYFTSATQEGHGVIWCNKGHMMSTRSISLVSNRRFQNDAYPDEVYDSNIDITDYLRSVVLVGLYNTVDQRITNIGSGFIVNKKRGLILTAAHTLMELESKKNFGNYYCGNRGKVVIGVIPETGHNNEAKAVFRYFAEIVAKDKMVDNKEKRCEIDACVLKIVTRLEYDVDGNGDGCGNQAEHVIMQNSSAMRKEGLKELKLAKHDCEVSECVHSIGFNQGGDGFGCGNQAEHVIMSNINRNFDFTRGYVSVVKLESNARLVNYSFSPRNEIVVNLECMTGHSGSPCMNREGKVVGMVSRSHPGETGRCYLVPWQNLRAIVKLAIVYDNKHF